MTGTEREVWITGLGLVSSLGEGREAHWARLREGTPPNVDAERFAPYPVHPLMPLDYSKQIAKRSDLNQMEAWQRIGVYTAGLALDDARLAKNKELLDRTHLVAAAGIGERDAKVDRKVLESMGEGDTDVLAKQVLPSALKPTLFLAQLSNLLAGNISIIHNVTGSSRTFMGEEAAGVSAVENAFRRIKAGQGDLFLAGGACNAEREDLLLGFELGRMLWGEAWQPVWERRGKGGMVLGSAGVFLVLEEKAHAQARGAKPYAAIAGVVSDRSARDAGGVWETLTSLRQRLKPVIDAGPLPVLSGASGVEPALSEEYGFIGIEGGGAAARAYGSRLGHTVEAHFPLGLALAALAVQAGEFMAPAGGEASYAGPVRQVLVTGAGAWRGEGMAVVKRAE